MRETIAALIFLAFVMSASIRNREDQRSMLYHGARLFARLIARFSSLLLAFVSGIEAVAESVPRAFRDGWMAERFMEDTVVDQVARLIESRQK